MTAGWDAPHPQLEAADATQEVCRETEEIDVLLERLEHALDETHRIQGEVLELFRLMLADRRPRTSAIGEEYSLPPRIAFMVQEACETLRVSENTMYEVLRRGQIESVRLGRGYRIPRRALEAFMAGD